MREPTAPAQNTRCHRCGGLLGFGSTMLTAIEPASPELLSSSPHRVLEFGWRQFDNWTDNSQMFCRRCGEHSFGVKEGPAPHRRGSPYQDAEGRINLASLPADVNFSVYGLAARPLGLRLNDLGWSGERERGKPESVRFRYVGEGPARTTMALELRQSAGGVGEPTLEHAYSELETILAIVRGHGPEELTREYALKGNIHRDWNLGQITRADRRRINVGIDGSRAEVEFAYWWNPAPVALANVIFDGQRMLAASVGLTHVQMLVLLKSMVILQGRQETVAGHQREYEEARGTRLS